MRDSVENVAFFIVWFELAETGYGLVGLGSGVAMSAHEEKSERRREYWSVYPLPIQSSLTSPFTIYSFFHHSVCFLTPLCQSSCSSPRFIIPLLLSLSPYVSFQVRRVSLPSMASRRRSTCVALWQGRTQDYIEKLKILAFFFFIFDCTSYDKKT